jgi:hypothetical protein
VKSAVAPFTRGDRNTLTREAEAIVALANAKALPSTCSSCGADVATGTRFCRQCGAPANSNSSPAELDLLNLTANANAGFNGAAWGTLFLIMALLFPLLLLIGPEDAVKFAKLVKVVSIAGGIIGAMGLAFLLNGLWKLGKVLSQPLERDVKEIPHAAVRRSLGTPDTSELISESAPPQSSVAEATTNLLPHEAKRANS